MAMPSVTVMVVNSRGVPPAALTPSFTGCAWRASAMLQGAASFQQVATPTNGRSMSASRQAHGVVVGAVRRPLGPYGDVPARQLRLVEQAGADVVGHGVASCVSGPLEE